MTPDQELRDSIAAAGCLDPLLIWHGTTIDGRRRALICEELGIVPRVLVMVTLEAACTALFQRHPERAIELAREHLGGEAGLRATVAELAAVCHTSVSRIAVLITPKKAPEKRAPHRTRAQRTQFVRFVAEPQWVHYVRLVGAAQGMNLSATIRKAGWEFVQRNAPNPPTEGSYRGPSRESVTVKPERRLLKRGR